MSYTKEKLCVQYRSGRAELHPESDIDGYAIIAELDPNKQDDILAEANAQRLVLCWNSHDALLEACEKARETTYHLGAMKIRDILEEQLDQAIAGAVKDS